MNNIFARPKKKSEIINDAIAQICEADKIKLTTKTPRKIELDTLASRVAEVVKADEKFAREIKVCISNDRDAILRKFNIKIKG